jgi:hypothetical protein
MISRHRIQLFFLALMSFVTAAQADFPIPPTIPTTCVTPNFTVQTITSEGAFPVLNTPACGGNPCSDFGYRITSHTLNADHAVFSVSSTLAILATASNEKVFLPFAGDDVTGFLAFVQHEYAVRFNSSGTKNVEAHLLVKGAAAPVGLSTVLVRSGTKVTESCVIGGPGEGQPIDQFQPIFQSQTALVAGGKCVAHLTFDSAGNIADVAADPPCVSGSPASGVLVIGDEPLRNNTGPHGITFGNGTTTCYGPPIPSIPKCICTKSPCP